MLICVFVSLINLISSIAVMSCDAPIIAHANVVPDGPYSYSDVVNVTCFNGHNTLDGSESYEIECGSDGTWCKNVSCTRKQTLLYIYVKK